MAREHYVTVTNHEDKLTPSKLVGLCWGADCNICGPLLDGNWYGREKIEVVALAHERNVDYAPQIRG